MVPRSCLGLTENYCNSGETMNDTVSVLLEIDIRPGRYSPGRADLDCFAAGAVALAGQSCNLECIETGALIITSRS